MIRKHLKEEDIDSQLEYSKMYQVLDADSSQIAAIQDVKAGRNLVVEGTISLEQVNLRQL